MTNTTNIASASENSSKGTELLSIDELLRRLGIDREHQAANTVLLSAKKHFITAQQNRIGDPEKLNKITDAIEVYLPEKTSIRKLSIGRRSSNRLEGYVAELAIAAFFTQEPLVSASQFRLLQAFILVLFISEHTVGANLNHALTVLRRAGNDQKCSAFIKSLPKPDGNNGDYLSALCILLETSPQAQPEEELFGAVRSVVRMAEKIKWNNGNLKHHHPIFRVVTRKSSYSIEEESASVELVLTTHSDPGMIPEFDEEYTVHTRPEMLQTSIDAEQDQTEGELKPEHSAKASRSAHWLRNSLTSTTVDPNLLDSFDRQIFTDWLAESFRKIDQDSAIAGILGFSFYFSRTIDEVAAMIIGVDFSATTYFKKVRLPEDGYVPDESLLDYYDTSVDCLALPIPQEIQLWTEALSKKEHLGQTIAEVYSLHSQEISKGCSSAIAQIKGNAPESRIKIRRIQSHFRTLIAAVTQDPVAVYVLTGREGDRPPATAYYLIREAQYYEELYEDIQRFMTGGRL